MRGDKAAGLERKAPPLWQALEGVKPLQGTRSQHGEEKRSP